MKIKLQPYLTSLRKSRSYKKEKLSNSSFGIKDILNSIFTAIIVVIVNQYYFEDNKRLEAKIEYEKEILREQTPILNRILAFTFKYEYSEVIPGYKLDVSYKFPKEWNKLSKSQILKLTESFADSMTEVMRDSMESSKFVVPSFVINTNKRTKFLNDLAFINSNTDLLNHEVYIVVDKLNDFIEENRLPDLNSAIDKDYSNWTNKKVKDEWRDINNELRSKCLNYINSLKKDF